jgi:hypothetical protein
MALDWSTLLPRLEEQHHSRAFQFSVPALRQREGMIAASLGAERFCQVSRRPPRSRHRSRATHPPMPGITQPCRNMGGRPDDTDSPWRPGSTGVGPPSRCRQFSLAPGGGAIPHASVSAVRDPRTPAVCTTSAQCSGQVSTWHRMCSSEGSQRDRGTAHGCGLRRDSRQHFRSSHRRSVLLGGKKRIVTPSDGGWTMPRARWNQYSTVFLRCALGTALLSAVADRY